MRLLMLALISPGTVQLLRKFNAQFLAMRGLNPDTHCHVLVKSKKPLDVDYAFKALCDMSRQQQMEAAANIALALQPDIIYFRYPYFDELCYRFVCQCPNTVFEHHALEWTEFDAERRKEEAHWGAKILNVCAGVVGVTDEIRIYQQQRSGRDLPGLTLSNGISCDDAPLAVRPPLEGELHIALAAYFSPRHGIDRLIKGMAAYDNAGQVHLHLAGGKSHEAGSEEKVFLDMASAAGLEERIHFHELLDAGALRSLLGRCHLASGTLAAARRGLGEVAALKHRTYTFEGIPFFYGGKDPDFPPELDFALRLPDDESPVDLELLWRFARNCAASSDLAKTMRRYAIDKLSWEAKSHKLLDFLHSLPGDEARAGQTAGPLFSCIVLCSPDSERAKVCLTSLLAQKEAALEIILVHAPEHEAVRDVLRDFISGCGAGPAIIMARAEGPARAQLREAGAKAASGQWLWSMPDDFTVAPGFFEAAASLIEEHPEASLISAEIAFAGERPPRCGPAFWRSFWDRHLKVRALLVRRKAWSVLYAPGAGLSWRRGDKALRRKCRRAGLPCAHLQGAMLFSGTSGFLRCLFRRLLMAARADI